MNNPTLEYVGCTGEPAGYKTLFKPAGEGCDSHQEHLNWNYHVPSRRHVWLSKQTPNLLASDGGPFIRLHAVRWNGFVSTCLSSFHQSWGSDLDGRNMFCMKPVKWLWRSAWTTSSSLTVFDRARAPCPQWQHNFREPHWIRFAQA